MARRKRFYPAARRCCCLLPFLVHVSSGGELAKPRAAGPSAPVARLVSPAQGDWVPSWESTIVYYALEFYVDGYDKCFQVDDGGPLCSPLAENASVAIRASAPGSWHTIAVSVIAKDGGAEVSHDTVRFFSAFSLEDPWGKLAAAGTSSSDSKPKASTALEVQAQSGTPSGPCLASAAIRNHASTISGSFYCSGFWVETESTSQADQTSAFSSSSSGGGSISPSRNLKKLNQENAARKADQRALEEAVARDGVHSILDVACGDMEWVARNFGGHVHDLNLGAATYLGVDSSSTIVERNRKAFPPGKSRFSFQQLDPASSPLPEGYELILVRHDLLAQQSEAENLGLLAKVEASGARFAVLGTHLTADDNLIRNGQVEPDIEGRRINLLQPPYCLRPPDRLYADDAPDRYIAVYDLRREGTPALRDLKGCSQLLRVPGFGGGTLEQPAGTVHKATVVTALFDLKRGATGDGRTMAYYLDLFKTTLRLNAPMVVYTERAFADFVLETRAARGMQDLTTVVVLTLAQIPYAWSFRRIGELMADEAFLSTVAKNRRVEFTLPAYVPLMFSKFDWLVEAASANRYDTPFFLWLDAGASRFFHGADIHQPWPCRSFSLPSAKITIGAYNYYQDPKLNLDSQHERDGFERGELGVFNGGLFGGDVASIKALATLARLILEDQLHRGMYANEQTALFLMYRNNSAFFNPVPRTAMGAAGLRGGEEGNLPLFEHMACPPLERAEPVEVQ